jgi:hypothetical protein
MILHSAATTAPAAQSAVSVHVPVRRCDTRAQATASSLRVTRPQLAHPQATNSTAALCSYPRHALTSTAAAAAPLSRSATTSTPAGTAAVSSGVLVLTVGPEAMEAGRPG